MAQSLGIQLVETIVEAAFVTMTANVKRSADHRGLSGVKLDGMSTAGVVQLVKGDTKKKRCC